MPSPLTPPMLGYGGDRNLLPLSVPSSHLGKQAHPMMYARTTSWISRKVSPTFLFRTSTMRGVSYSKRNVDSLSMHLCPTAMPGLCCWPQCLPPPRGLGCARRHSSVCRGIKIKINRMIRIKKNAIGGALCSAGLSGFLLCTEMGFPLPISTGLGAAVPYMVRGWDGCWSSSWGRGELGGSGDQRQSRVWCRWSLGWIWAVGLPLLSLTYIPLHVPKATSDPMSPC